MLFGLTLRVFVAVHCISFSGKNATVGQLRKFVGGRATRRQVEKALVELLAEELITSYGYNYRPGVIATRFEIGAGDTTLTMLYAATGHIADYRSENKKAYDYVWDRFLSMSLGVG